MTREHVRRPKGLARARLFLCAAVVAVAVGLSARRPAEACVTCCCGYYGYLELMNWSPDDLCPPMEPDWNQNRIMYAWWEHRFDCNTGAPVAGAWRGQLCDSPPPAPEASVCPEYCESCYQCAGCDETNANGVDDDGDDIPDEGSFAGCRGEDDAPVVFASGRMHTTRRVDIALPETDGFSLSLTRTWVQNDFAMPSKNGILSTTNLRPTSFGVSWRHSFDGVVIGQIGSWAAPNDLSWKHETGTVGFTEPVFLAGPPAAWRYRSQYSTDFELTVYEDRAEPPYPPAKMVIREPATQREWWFDYFDGSDPAHRQAQLVRMQRSNAGDTGHSIRVQREATGITAGRIQMVVEHFGVMPHRTLEFSYASSPEPVAKVTEVIDHAPTGDRTYTYTYLDDELPYSLYLARVDRADGTYERYPFGQAAHRLEEIIVGPPEVTVEDHRFGATDVVVENASMSRRYAYRYDFELGETTQLDLLLPTKVTTCDEDADCTALSAFSRCWTAAEGGDGACYRSSTYLYDPERKQTLQTTGVCRECGDGSADSAILDYYPDDHPDETQRVRLKAVSTPGGTMTTYSWAADGQPHCIVEGDSDREAEVGGVCAGPGTARITERVPGSNEEDITTASVLDPNSPVVEHKEYSDGRPTTRSLTGTTRLADATGTLEQRTRTTVNHYDSQGRLDWVDGPLADVAGYDRVDFAYHSSGADAGHLATVTRFVGTPPCPGPSCAAQVTSYSDYDASGTARRIVDPAGVVTALETDAAGRVVRREVGEPSGVVTTYAYDALGRLTEVVADGMCMTIEYAANNAVRARRRSAASDAYCGVTPILDDDAGRGGEIERYFYQDDDPARLAKVERLVAGGAVKFRQEYGYDEKRQRTSASSWQPSRPETWDYDIDGLLAWHKLATCYEGSTNCVETQYERDTLGRRTEIERLVTASTAAVTAFGYAQPENALPTTVTTGDGTVTATSTTYEYDDFGQLVTVASPDSGTTRYEHDVAGRLVKKVTAWGQAGARTTTYQYDSLGRLLFVDNGAGVSNTCNPGDVKPLADVEYTYDTCASPPTGFSCGTYTTGRLTVARAYLHCSGGAAFSRRTWHNYDRVGRIAATATANDDELASPRIMSYAYTTGGHLDHQVDVWGVWRRYEVSEASGAVTAIRDVSYNPYLSNALYEPFGPPKEFTTLVSVGGTSVKRFFGRYLDYRPASITSNLVGASWTYQRDVAGRVTMRDSHYQTSSVIDRYYCYDRLGRLTHEATTGGCPETVTALRARYTYHNGASATEAPDNRASALQRNADQANAAALAYTLNSGSNRLATVGGTLLFGDDSEGRRSVDRDSSLTGEYSDHRSYYYLPNGRLGKVYGKVPYNSYSGGQWTRGWYVYTMSFAYDHRERVVSATYWQSNWGYQTLYSFFYDESDRLIAAKIVPNSTASPYLLWSYIHLGSEVVAAERRYWNGFISTTTKMAVLNDEHGVPYQFLDAAGTTLYLTDHEGFGWRQPKTVAANMWVPFGLPGQIILEETVVKAFAQECTVAPCTIYYKRPPIALHGARDYDPYVGRFLEADPASLMAWQRIMEYTYADNDSINAVDRSGCLGWLYCDAQKMERIIRATASAISQVTKCSALKCDPIKKARWLFQMYSATFVCEGANNSCGDDTTLKGWVEGHPYIWPFDAWSGPIHLCDRGLAACPEFTIAHEALHKAWIQHDEWYVERGGEAWSNFDLETIRCVKCDGQRTGP